MSKQPCWGIKLSFVVFSRRYSAAWYLLSPRNYHFGLFDVKWASGLIPLICDSIANYRLTDAPSVGWPWVCKAPGAFLLRCAGGNASVWLVTRRWTLCVCLSQRVENALYETFFLSSSCQTSSSGPRLSQQINMTKAQRRRGWILRRRDLLSPSDHLVDDTAQRRCPRGTIIHLHSGGRCLADCKTAENWSIIRDAITEF